MIKYRKYNGYYDPRLSFALLRRASAKQSTAMCNPVNASSVGIVVKYLGEVEWWYSSQLPNRPVEFGQELIQELIKDPVEQPEVSTKPQPTCKDILYINQLVCLRNVGTIVKPTQDFVYSGESFLTRNYGRIVRLMGSHVLVKWEHTLNNESYLSDFKHWIVPLRYLVGVKHRDVLMDFEDSTTRVTLVNTSDKEAIIGKSYYLYDGKEVVAADRSLTPFIVEPAPSYMYVGCRSLESLYDKKTEVVVLPPSASILE